MSELRVPERLARTLRERGASGDEWLEALPALLDELALAWSLVIGEPYDTGSTSWTAPVLRTTDQARLVLKVGLRDPESTHEAEALAVWDGYGAVRLFESWSNDQTSALLVERCEPGTELWNALPQPQQDVVVAQCLDRLWVEPAPGNPFLPLKDMCELWAAECEKRLEQSPPSDVGLVREGLAIWRDLPSTAERHMLLATDLHGGNILAAQREPWLAIDPSPYVGDPTYDPMQHMTNCASRLAEDPHGLCDRMARLTGVDPRRLRYWMFARLVVDSGWPFGTEKSPTTYDVARRLAP